jgi:transposase
MPAAQVFGVDVSKAELVIACLGSTRIETLRNNQRAIGRWLAQLPEPALIGAESTGSLQQPLLEAAYAAGHQVFLLDPRAVKAFRRVIGERAKTDRCDAALIARYVASQHAHLYPWRPPAAALASLQSLLRRRARIATCRVRIEATLRECPECDARPALRALGQLLRSIDRRCRELLALESRRKAQQANLASIPGLGALSSTGMLVHLERTPYRSSDAAVAGTGLDPRPDDSGLRRGERHLSKHGDSELRRLLYNSAMAARRHPYFATLYQRHRDRGLPSTAALIVIARKLVRIAYAVYRSGQPFDESKLFTRACHAT